MFPDYQGIGIGHVVSSLVGEIMLKEGKRFLSVTSHPAFIHSRQKDPRWRMGRVGRITGGGISTSVIHNQPGNSQVQSNGRLTASFEYMGEKSVKSKNSVKTV